MLKNCMDIFEHLELVISNIYDADCTYILENLCCHSDFGNLNYFVSDF